MKPSVVFVLPATSLHGGTRVVFELARGLAGRGYPTRVVSPEPAPTWHRVEVPYEQIALFEPGAIPKADIAIGTFYLTVGPAYESGARAVFHLSQGYEGVHREYADILDQIDAAYRLPIPKLLISRHLEPVLTERYGCRCHWIGQFVDQELFSPGEPRAPRETPVFGVVGPFGIRSKGIPELLAGLKLARQAGFDFEVRRASAEPASDEERALGVTDLFAHHLPTHQMPAFYRGLDALLYSSYDEEGFPLPPLEAMACGIPVALTTIRPFAVLPDEAVLRFPPGEPAALLPIVAELCDPPRRSELAAAALECMREYRLERVLDRLEAAFAAEGV